MENLKVSLTFPISEKLSKITVSVEEPGSSNKVNQSFDLLPGYPLDNYVKFTLTKYQMQYGKAQNSPQTEERYN